MLQRSSVPKSWALHKIPEVLFFQEGPGVRSRQYTNTGVKLLNVGNINNGVVDLSTTSRHVSNKEAFGRYQHFLVNDGDLLIGSSGVTVETFHKKIAFAEKRHLPLCMNTSTIRFWPLESNLIDLNFFRRFLGTRLFTSQLRRLITGTAQLNFGPSHLKQMMVPLPTKPDGTPDIDEQRRIAAILDKADAVRRKRQEAIRLSEELLRSAFLEMFGDPVTNPKGWDVVDLGKVSEIQGGLQVTHKRSVNPIEVPYLRVANVFRGRLNLEEIKQIRATKSEIGRVRLSKGDVLFVEGHGNPEEIGRAAVWDGSIEQCVHQNHLIRVRVHSDVLIPEYISALVNSDGGRRNLQRMGKTTSGLNTISSKQLSKLKVFVPAIEIQKEYLELIEKTKMLQDEFVSHSRALRNLFHSLVQRAFRGDL